MHLQNRTPQHPAAASQKEARTVDASQVMVAQSAIVAQAWQVNRREIAQCLSRLQECCQNQRTGWGGGSPDMVGLSCSHTRSGACLRKIRPEIAYYLRRHLLAARFAAIAATTLQTGHRESRGVVMLITFGLNQDSTIR